VRLADLAELRQPKVEEVRLALEIDNRELSNAHK